MKNLSNLHNRLVCILLALMLTLPAGSGDGQAAYPDPSTALRSAAASDCPPAQTPLSGADISGLAAGPDGALWFSDDLNHLVGRLPVGSASPVHEEDIQLFTLPRANSHPVSITAGPDGALWFIDNNSILAHAISRITTSGTITEYELPAHFFPWKLINGSDGYLWFLAWAGDTGTMLGKVSTHGAFLYSELPESWDYTVDLIAGPAGSSGVWIASGGLFSEGKPKKVGFAQFSGANITINSVVTIPEADAANAGPFAISYGPDGNLWYLASPNMGRIAPDGTITSYPAQWDASHSRNPNSGKLLNGPDGALWVFTGSSGDGDWGNILTRVTFENNVPVQFSDIENDFIYNNRLFWNQYTAAGNLYFPMMAAGPDGSVWFAVDDLFTDLRFLLRMETDSTISSLEAPEPLSVTYSADLGIVYAGSQGMGGGSEPCTVDWPTWHTPPSGASSTPRDTTPSNRPNNDPNDPDKMQTCVTGTNDNAANGGGGGVTTVCFDGSFDTAHSLAAGEGTEQTVYPLPDPYAGPRGIVQGPDGALWFTEIVTNKIARLDATSGAVLEYPVPTPNSQPQDITLGGDGALWFTESAADKIGRVTTSGQFQEYVLPATGRQPYGITAGPDGALWFTERAGNRIGRISLSGAITEYLLPTAGAEPLNITAGEDGALWFTEVAANQVGRITTAGVISEFPLLQPDSHPTGITSAPGNMIWFTQPGANLVSWINAPTVPRAMLSIAASAGGWVRILPTGSSCAGACSQALGRGMQVTLLALPNADVHFYGWGGACAGTGPCQLTLSADTQVSANFSSGPAPKKIYLPVIVKP